MSYSTIILDYMQYGVAADRPAAPNVNTAAGCVAFYYATDTGVLSLYDGSWHTLVSGGGGTVGGSDGDIQFNNAGALGGKTLTNGQVLIGRTGNSPLAAALTAGSGITITPASGSITIAAAGSGLTTFAPQGRLTLSTDTPIMTSDQTAKSTVYYTAFVGDQVPVNGSLLTITSGEISMGLDAGVPRVASGSIYDVFAISNGGSLAIGIGPAWSSSSSRGTGAGTTEIYRKNGIWVNKNSITNLYGGAAGTTNLGPVAADEGTYLGSIYATANGQTGVQFRPAAAAGGSNTKIGLYNAYNKIEQSHWSQDSTSTWTYNTTTWRQANNNASNRITWLDGLGDLFVKGHYYAASENNTSGKNTFIGVNFNATTGAPAGLQGAVDTAGNTAFVLPAPSFNTFVGIGLNYAQAMENTDGGIGTWFGPNYNLLAVTMPG